MAEPSTTASRKRMEVVGRPASWERPWHRPVIGIVGLGLLLCYVFGVFSPSAPPGKPFAKEAVLPTSEIAPGVLWHEVRLAGGSDARVLWIYTPKHPAAGKMPCVFIAPSGSTCFFGRRLEVGTHAEHVPYVLAGYTVVAYAVDGAVADFNNTNDVVHGTNAFRAAHMGVDNEKAAVDYALKTLPGVDPNRLYVAGHSSAGTVALMAAAHDPRIAGCIAYAPGCNIPDRVNALGTLLWSIRIPGFRSFIRQCSPIEYTTDIRCPVLIFHADDDATIRTSEVAPFVGKLRRTNHRVTYLTVATGGHGPSMMDVGIPQGILWLKKQSAVEDISELR